MHKWILLGLLLLLPPNLGALDLSHIPSTRSNPEDFSPAPQNIDPLSLIKQAPPFVVPDRTEKLLTYPCTGCHTQGIIKANPKIRPLQMMHQEINLVHGKGRFWCTTCHSTYERDNLTSLKGQPIGFNQAYLLCGQCHQHRLREFIYGAHGKRIGSWEENRTLLNCTECHNPHVPQIKPRKPRSAPAVRAGLRPMKPPIQEHPPFWPSNLDDYQRH